MPKIRGSKTFALTALTITALSVAAYPTVKKKLYGASEFSEQHVLQNNIPVIPVVGQPTEQLAEKTRIDVVFALDTTGSMGGLIQRSQEKRTLLKKQIGELSEKRSAYIRRKVDASGGSKNSLDEKIFSSIKKQAEQRGIVYLKDDAVL